MSSEGVKKIPGSDLYTGVWYTVSMKRFPNGFVTWTEATNDYGANFVQIAMNPNHLPHYQPGGKWREDVQWRFSATEDPSWYTWENRVLSKSNGITNWSYKKVGSGQHIIISTRAKEVGELRPGGPLRTAALWKPVKYGDGHILVNKTYETSPITWTAAKYGQNSHYIQVVTAQDHWQHYSAGGKWFEDAQFVFTPSDV